VISPSLRSHAAKLTVILLLGVGFVGVGAGSAQADPVVLQPGELVVNGDAEQAVTVGWTGSLLRHTHGSGGYPNSVIVDSGGATGATYPGGSALFHGNGASSVATQTIDLGPSASAIDNANVDALLSVYIGGYAGQRDRATVTYQFADAVGSPVAPAVVFGPVELEDRGGTSGFIHFDASVRLPVGTRQAVVTISTQRFTAPANDGYVDNVSLILDAPSPAASPDTATTQQDVAVTLDPPANDTAGLGAALLPGSVRLLDGGTPVTSLTTPDGTYLVNTTNGQVLFTPAAGFFGTTAPVPYRITDSSGQQAESTLQIEVAFLAVPELTLVKSATPSDAADFAAGTEVTYSFVVTNSGNVTIEDIAIDEVGFSGTDGPLVPVCPDTTLDPGEQVVCTADYTVSQDDFDSGELSNTATASGVPAGSVDAIVSNESGFAIPADAAPGISLVKSVSPAVASAAGDVVGYSFLITNTGNVSLHTAAVAETAFSGTGTAPAADCPSTVLLPGQQLTCVADYTVTQDDVDAGTVANTATASMIAPDDSAATSSPSSATLTLTPQPSIDLVKSADRTNISAAGQVIVYTYAITNTGNSTLTGLGIQETSFSGAGTLSSATCPTAPLAPGDVAECSATYTTVALDLSAAAISNSATAAAETLAGTGIASFVSTVSTPIVVSEPAGDGPELASTGAEPAPSLLMGGGLALCGAALVVVAMLSRRRLGRG
jgi:CshA-type fibril repeat protein